LVRSVASNAQSVKGEQVVATFKFKALGDGSASSQITVDEAQSLLVSSSGNHDLLKSGNGTLLLK
jgi:hypothetical protein